jgi:Zn-dependent protease with chaperone function
MRFRRHQEAARASSLRLIVLFVLVLGALVLAVNAALAAAYRYTVPFAQGYPTLFFETNTAIVLLFVLGGCWLEGLRLREGGAHVARMAGGRPARASGHTPGERLERRLHHVIQELALASRIPAPAAWVLPRDDAINAFAAGWSHEDAVIAVTRGALERLTREELQGVVAHEFSHVVHGDARLNMRLVGLVWGLQMIFLLGRSLSQPDEQGRRPFTTSFGWALLATGWLGWAAGRLLQAAVSRQREFLADASAVQYTRMVHGLGGALRKIAHQSREHTDRLQAPQATSLAHLFLNAPGRRWLWSTHPPIAERLRRLYGCRVEPLPAEPLPAPADDEFLTGFAPHPTTAAPQEGVHPDSGNCPVRDPTHDPAWHGECAREEEALARVALWYGAGQCQAALLLWLSGSTAVALEGVAPRLVETARQELAALSPLTRLDTMAMLARRLRDMAPAHLPGLRRAAREAPQSATGRLRRLLLTLWLRPPHAARLPSRSVGLESLGDEVATATVLLSVALVLPRETAVAWRSMSLAACGTAPRAGQLSSTARWALRLRHLTPMQRPRLVRAWVDSLPPNCLAASRTELLQIVCRLLDTPEPPLLQQRAANVASSAKAGP